MTDIEAPPDPPIDDDKVQQAQVEAIGRRVRQLRRRRLMLLSELAESSGLSVKLLSRLENGAGNPAFGALGAIARTFNVGVDTLFETADESLEAVIAPRDRLVLRVAEAGDVTVELLSPELNSKVVALLLTIGPGHVPGAVAACPPGQQFETVLDGSVELQVGDERHQLGVGDSVTFEASRPHRRHNLDASQPARLMVLATEFRIDSYFPERSAGAS